MCTYIIYMSQTSEQDQTFKGTSLHRLNFSRSWSRLKNSSKCYTIECVVDINYYVDFMRQLLRVLCTPSLTLDSWAHYHSVCSFPMLYSGITKLSLASQIKHQDALSFTYRLWTKSMLGRPNASWSSCGVLCDFKLKAKFLFLSIKYWKRHECGLCCLLVHCFKF